MVLLPVTFDKDEDIEANVVSILEIDEEDWRKPLINFLQHGKLPFNPRHKIEVKCRASHFIYFKCTLYMRSFDGIFLRCLDNEEASRALQDAHSETCGAYQFRAKLHFQIKRMGYYWPTMVKDSMEYAKRCQACQFHATTSINHLSPYIQLSHLSHLMLKIGFGWTIAQNLYEVPVHTCCYRLFLKMGKNNNL